MKRKAMALSTLGYLMVGLFLFLILTFIYFGGTGFFQKIYKLTDKLGLTKLAQAVREKEENITGSNYVLTPEEKAAEEKVKAAMKTMMEGIDACLKGQNCVCPVSFPQFPDGYAMRFMNSDNKVYVSFFRFKSRNWRSDFDENYQGQTGVHFVSGATHSFENTKACLVVDLAEEWVGADVSEIAVKDPYSGMIQLYWSGNDLLATEAKSPGVTYNSERDYRIYGAGGPPNIIYKTNGGNFCFFAERWGWDDDKLINGIKCGKSQEKLS